MSIDRWSWSWANEHTRGRMLRDALEDVQASHAASTRRLSSRLSELQGSLQNKLDALSEAFDAYVELGDVREQLRELPDWSHTRRAVQATLTSLMEGEQPAPLDPAEHDHWVADAMNTVVALVTGTDPSAYEARALAKSDQAGLFIVLTSLALGAGDRLDGRLAAVFDGVMSLDEDHFVLLKAAVAGLTTTRELELLGDRLAPALDDPTAWRVWLGISDSSPSDYLRIEQFLETGLPPGATTATITAAKPGQDWDYQALESQLSQRAAVLARSASKEEAALQTRAMQLRARVEDPTGQRPAEVERRGVVDTVQRLLRLPGTPEESRLVIAGWLRRPLASIAEELRALGAGPALTSTYTQHWSAKGSSFRRIRLEVTQDGPDRQALRAAERTLQELEPEGRGASTYFGAAIAAAAVGLLLLMLGSDWVVVSVLLLLGALGLGVYGIIRKRVEMQVEQGKTDAVQQLREGTRRMADELRAQEAERLVAAQETTDALDALIRRLGSTHQVIVPSAGQ